MRQAALTIPVVRTQDPRVSFVRPLERRRWIAFVMTGMLLSTLVLAFFVGEATAQPKSIPSKRWLHAMAYDSESDRVVLFGGTDSNFDLGDTWAYDLNTNAWTNMDPATRPGARGYHALAYDSQSDRIVLFGGKTDNKQRGISDETWAYDLNANAWTKK